MLNRQETSLISGINWDFLGKQGYIALSLTQHYYHAGFQAFWWLVPENQFIGWGNTLCNPFLLGHRTAGPQIILSTWDENVLMRLRSFGCRGQKLNLSQLMQKSQQDCSNNNKQKAIEETLLESYWCSLQNERGGARPQETRSQRSFRALRDQNQEFNATSSLSISPSHFCIFLWVGFISPQCKPATVAGVTTCGSCMVLILPNSLPKERTSFS